MTTTPRRLAVAAAVAATAALGAPAHASHPTAPPQLNIVAGANYTGVILNGLFVVFECHAVALRPAASVAINACYITTGKRILAIALPGQTAVIAGSETVGFAPFQVCWTATATFIDATTATTSGCTDLPPENLPSLLGTGVSSA